MSMFRLSFPLLPRRITGLTRLVSTDQKMSIIFTVSDKPGALQHVLNHFAEHKINMTHIESRPASLMLLGKEAQRAFDFFIDFTGEPTDENVKKMLEELSENCHNVTVTGSKEVPWFPRRKADLELVCHNILDAGAELVADHPGFHDLEYRKRRKEIASLADNYIFGDPIPRVKYTSNELATWKTVWNMLVPKLHKHACAEYNHVLPLFQHNCGYSENNIPQFADISKFLHSCTGFTLCPVSGLLSARDFLNALAFRVFFSTQYIRHHSKPLYTPEPDIVHELLGHVPLFSNPEFADFSQAIGLASIGASEEQLTKLARVYWYTVEFGICQQNGVRKAYGAGLLSSAGELEYSMGLSENKPLVVDFDPFEAAKHEYPITTYQPKYYLAKSFEDAKIKIRSFSESLDRGFHVSYSTLTQSLEVDRNVKLVSHPSVSKSKSKLREIVSPF